MFQAHELGVAVKSQIRGDLRPKPWGTRGSGSTRWVGSAIGVPGSQLLATPTDAVEALKIATRL